MVTHGRRRMLIIEDDVALAAGLRRVLSADYSVTHEVRAIDCLARLEAGERFDLILCDVDLPGLLGPDLWHTVLRIAPEQAARFVFVTGSKGQELVELFEDVTAPCLSKPLDLGALREVVSLRGDGARVRPRDPIASGW